MQFFVVLTLAEVVFPVIAVLLYDDIATLCYQLEMHFLCFQQIQAKFEHLMLVHQEEKLKLEKKRKALEEEIAVFNMKKANAELLQTQPMVSTPVSLKRDKDRKK